MKHFIINNNEIIEADSIDEVYIELSMINFGYVDELTLGILKNKVKVFEIIPDCVNGKPALHYV